MVHLSWPKVFRTLWRLNAIGIFLGLLGGLLLLGVGLISVLGEVFAKAPQPPTPAVTVAEGASPLRLTAWRDASGGLLQADLAEADAPRGIAFKGSGSEDRVRNVLFLDPSSGRSWWLLQDHRQQLIESHAFHLQPPGTLPDPGTAPRAILHALCPGDGHGPQSLLLASPDGRRSTLLPGVVQAVLHVHTLDAATGHVLVRVGDGYHLLRLDLSTLTLREAKRIDLPALPSPTNP